MEITISNKTIVRAVLIVAAVVLGLQMAGMLKTQLIWVLSAFFLAVALEPAVSRLSKFMPGRGRGLSVALVLAAVLGLLSFIVVALVPPFASELYNLVRHLPDAYADFAKANPQLGDLVETTLNTENATSAIRQFSNQLLNFGGSAVGVVKGVFGGLLAIITTLLLTFFMVLEGPTWSRRIWNQVSASHRSKYQPLVKQLQGTVTGFVGGITLTASIAASASAIMLLVLGAPYALALGLLVGVVAFIPMVGATVAGILVTLAVLVFKGLTAALIMAGFFLVYQMIENYFLQPIIFSKTLEVSPLIVFLSLIIGASLAGFIGALVAIPAAASAMILLKFYLRERDNNDDDDKPAVKEAKAGLS
jgi:predicted PurR-regulated permease PerM